MQSVHHAPSKMSPPAQLPHGPSTEIVRFYNEADTYGQDPDAGKLGDKVLIGIIDGRMPGVSFESSNPAQTKVYEVCSSALSKRKPNGYSLEESLPDFRGNDSRSGLNR